MKILWLRCKNWFTDLFRGSRGKSGVTWGSLVLLAFSGKVHKARVLLPVNFDLERHKAQYPPENYGFQNKAFRNFKALHILNLLSEIPGWNSDLIREDGFVPIHMTTLRNRMKDCKLYVDYLVNTGVLVCDGRYIIGEKSMWYRWADQYAGSIFHSSEEIVSNFGSVRLDNPEDRKNYPHLFYWYDRKNLRINPRACDYAEGIRKLKMQDDSHKSWDWNRDTQQFKHPDTQYLAVLRNIDKITAQEYGVHIDDNVHRLHSVLTNIQKDFRNFITYGGQPLVSIDIKNCQPYLSCLLLKPEFWQRGADIPLTLYDLPENIQTLFQSQILEQAIKGYFDELSNHDIEQYIYLVSSGGIYEQIRDIANQHLKEGQSRIERKDAKVLMFYLLFSSNRGQHDDPTINELRRIFSTELYPKVAELFRIIKREYADAEMDKPHSRLSRLLQSIESTIMLHRCCKRIWEEGRLEIPIFTIHDSIVTTCEHQEYVQAVIAEEFAKNIGVGPALSIETWSEKNLDQNIYNEIHHPGIV